MPTPWSGRLRVPTGAACRASGRSPYASGAPDRRFHVVHVRVRFKGPIRQDKVAQITKQAALKATKRTQGRIQRNIRAKGRVNTGRMVNSVTIERVPGKHPLNPTFEVGARTAYAAYQEKGTRAHGPVKARRMVFSPKGSSETVFAKWVRGIRGAHFVRDAVRLIKPSDFH
uniref:Type I neck protein n=1 Tax=Dulem virus 38 TaxID=3145756 RepID=A0AAU8B1N9_9CAUD